jgi:hypothetical protein
MIEFSRNTPAARYLQINAPASVHTVPGRRLRSFFVWYRSPQGRTSPRTAHHPIVYRSGGAITLRYRSPNRDTRHHVGDRVMNGRIARSAAAINKVSEDARRSYQAMADKRDASGHVYTINCECAHH